MVSNCRKGNSMKKNKSVLTVLMSMLLIMAPVLYVNAEEHICIRETIRTSIGPYSYQDLDGHLTTYKVVTKCNSCPNVFDVKFESGREGHAWTHPEDLGHSGKYDHKFKLTCSKCGGNREVTIICDFLESGHHNTP